MKKNLGFILLTPLFMIVGALSAFIVPDSTNNTDATRKEKLSYEVMVINADVLKDYYNGTNNTGANNAGAGNKPEIFTAIIFQHQNLADSQNKNGQRHKFRCIAYIRTATSTHLITNSGSTYFLLNDKPGFKGKPVPLGGADGSSDIFGDYILTKDSLDLAKLSAATTVLLYPEPLTAADGSSNYVHYRIIYCPGGDPECKDFLKGLSPIKGDDQKLQDYIYKFNLAEKITITSTGFLNPSPPA